MIVMSSMSILTSIIGELRMTGIYSATKQSILDAGAAPPAACANADLQLYRQWGCHHPTYSSSPARPYLTLS
jgi:hypothetical protein